MKNIKTHKKFSSALYLVFLALFLYSTSKRSIIVGFSEKHYHSVIKYSPFNPFQQLSSVVYAVVIYVEDFLTFRLQKNQTEKIVMQLSALNARHKALSITISEIQKTVLSASSEIHTPSVVELLVKVSNYNNSQVYFKSKKDIPNNALVMSYNCIIGRVIDKKDNLYQVLTIKDSNFRLPVITQSSQVFGILYGGSVLKFIPFSDNPPQKIQEGEAIITASSVENFPPNIQVGTVNVEGESITVNNACNGYYHFAFII